jgi:hypothetical protein
MSEKPDIVLVHGARADGSSWSAVIEEAAQWGSRSSGESAAVAQRA